MAALSLIRPVTVKLHRRAEMQHNATAGGTFSPGSHHLMQLVGELRNFPLTLRFQFVQTPIVLR
jgi:hypothetical protein